ncbi:JAB domain-containing protein [Pedobacter helvus]|uniref:JAB domain-containing protein n=1 Tax=Pedobacter helvus TaxID=2563444 RepID=A0ABW9JH57_9SPHI
MFTIPCKVVATSLILVHNHESRDLGTSGQDITITEKLVKTARFLEMDIDYKRKCLL